MMVADSLVSMLQYRKPKHCSIRAASSAVTNSLQSTQFIPFTLARMQLMQFRLIEQDPFNHNGRLLSVHISAQVELALKNQLFYYAHKLVDESPSML